ncbi:mechanosensitive ion channel family protein [Vampirovibrio sp.]|uniref:mechanosensitive ion channel family protein n=1 Tax=Vampirovibrio sp. TaxID=2717857 RepID=UPI0035939180
MYLLQASVTNHALQTVQKMVKSLYDHLPYLVAGLIVFLCFLIGANIAKRILVKIGERTRLDVTLACLLGRLASAGIVILGILVAAVIIFPTFKPVDLMAGLGLTSVAIGFAFKDILQNFFAGIFILWRKPFRIGDQINANGFEGTVEDLNIRSTHIRTYDGTVVVIPNGALYSRPVQVKTAYEHRRVMVSVGIGYLHSIEEARSRIQKILTENEGVENDPGPWIYVAELAPSSVNFNIYFWTGSDQATVLKVTDQVMTAIKRTLDEGGIDIPYPHQVVLFHDATGTRQDDIQRSAYLASLTGGNGGDGSG